VSGAMKVALLDDHPLIRYALRLHSAGLPGANITADFGRTADLLRFLKRTAVDAVIVDYKLGAGDLSGVEMLRCVRMATAARIIVFSADTSEAVRRVCLREGAQVFVQKKESVDALYEALQAA